VEGADSVFVTRLKQRRRNALIVAGPIPAKAVWISVLRPRADVGGLAQPLQ